MFKKLPLYLMLFSLAACVRQTKDTFTYNTDPGKDSSIVIHVVPDSLKPTEYAFSDTLVIRMDSTGKTGWVDQSIKLTELQKLVQDSLLSIYLHTGKLPAALDMQYLGTVTMGIRGNVDDQIRQAQEVVRNVVAVAEYKTPFGRLHKKYTDSLQKKYPVLFEKFY